MGTRAKISEDLSDRVLFECDRTCCVCKTSGKYVQIHHIDQNPSNSTYENLIVLCLECHSDVHITGGFGRNWTAGQLQHHKEEWITRVKRRKDEADKLASKQSVIDHDAHTHFLLEDIEYRDLEDPSLSRYLKKIQIAHDAQKAMAQIDFDTGITMDTNQASDNLIDFYESVLAELAAFYPKGHFQEKHPRIFFSEQIAARRIFQAFAARPVNEGFIPQMHRMFIAYRTTRDVRQMVRDIAVALMEISGQFEPDECTTWAELWMKD
jgi:hypothetical protein